MIMRNLEENGKISNGGMIYNINVYNICNQKSLSILKIEEQF